MFEVLVSLRLIPCLPPGLATRCYEFREIDDLTCVVLMAELDGRLEREHNCEGSVLRTFCESDA